MSRGKMTFILFAGEEAVADGYAGNMAAEAKETAHGTRFTREWLACPPVLRYM
jgi:hypothetical protein